MAFFHTNFMLQTPHHEEEGDDDDHNHPSTSLSQLLPSCNPQEFHGVDSLLGKRASLPFAARFDHDMNISHNHGEEELSDDGSQLGEKKKRLNMEQVRMLERNFELGSKLEPDRKMQLARALGLQPRQIAIWFQNRRARWKTKKLEKDYDLLKRQFQAVKAENEALEAQNQKLHAEIVALKNGGEPTESINLNKLETEGSSSNRSENTSEVIKLDIISRSADHHHHHPSSSAINNSNNNEMNSPLSTNPSRPHLFPSSLQLFQRPTASKPPPPPPQNHHGPARSEHPQNANSVKEENLCNIFCAMDDQTGFWPWLEQHQFN